MCGENPLGRGERALYSSILEEERGLSTLPYWKRGEGSLLFQYGRGERDRSPSILEEGRGLSPFPYWKKSWALSSLLGRRVVLSPLPYWKRREYDSSSNMEDERERDSEKVKNKCYCYWDSTN